MADTNKVYEDIDAWMAEPSQVAPDEEKNGLEYGLSVAKKIEMEWFSNSGNYSRFYDKREEYERLRLYAVAEQSVEDYKKKMEEDGDTSYLNLDWEPVHIIPKFVDIIINGVQDSFFKVVAKSIDPFASKERDRYKDRLKAEMKQRDELNALQAQMDQSGVDVNVFEDREGDFPENQEELEVHLDLEYKQGIEIAVESSIDYFFKTNRYYDEVKKRCDRDLVEIGIDAVRHDFSSNDGITITYLDPQDIIHSETKSPDFNDLYYTGVVETTKLATIHERFPHLDVDELDRIKEIGKAYDEYQGLNNTYYDYNDIKNDPNEVQLLTFYWKTTNNVIDKIGEHRKYGTRKASKQNESFEGPKTADAKFEKSERVEEVIYEGVKVLGDDQRVLRWRKMKNMVRKSSSDVNVQMPIIISAPKYKDGRVDSPVKRMIKYADLIQITHIKLQQTIQRLNPSGVYIDADGLAEIDLGNGTTYGPKEALKMYFQTGSVVGRSMTVDGDPNGGKVPIQELPGGGGGQVELLIGAFNYYLDMIRQVTGINEVREGANPGERSLVGVQKLAAASSNTATRHIENASLYRSTRLAEGISLRLKDILEYGKTDNPGLYNNLVESISTNNVAMLEDIEDQHLHSFGIVLEASPNQEEKAILENNIQQALAKDQIYLEDAMTIREVNNVKLANKILGYRRRKKLKLDQQLKDNNIKAQAQANAEANAQAEKAKLGTQRDKMQGEIAKQREAAQQAIAKLNAETADQMKLMELEFKLKQKEFQMQSIVDAKQTSQKIDGEVQKEKVKQKPTFEAKGTDSRPNGTTRDKKFGPT